MGEATSNDKARRTIHNKKKQGKQLEGNEIQCVRVELRRNGYACKTHATLVLGPGGSQKQGREKAGLGRPGSCGGVRGRGLGRHGNSRVQGASKERMG